MNHFLSKPIRRPQLKKVLKQYCSPIPEENEEAEKAEAQPQQPPQSANERGSSMVIVNSTGLDTPPDATQEPTGLVSVPKDPPKGTDLQASSARERPPSPVSPFTDA